MFLELSCLPSEIGKEDINELVKYFLSKSAEELKSDSKTIENASYGIIK